MLSKKLTIVKLNNQLQNNLSIVNKNLKLLQKLVQDKEQIINSQRSRVQNMELDRQVQSKLSTVDRHAKIQRRYNVVSIVSALIHSKKKKNCAPDDDNLIIVAKKIVDQIEGST